MYKDKKAPWRAALCVSIAGALVTFSRQSWGLLALELVTITLFLLFWQLERATFSSREIAVVAVLGTIAAVARVPFSILPSVQPTTFQVVVSGFVFGPHIGFAVGATAALVSNFFLGQGPWTPWQMFAWGLAGASAGYLGRFRPRLGRWGIAAFTFVWGYLFGWIMNLWFWTGFVQPLNWQSFLASCAASCWFDTLHAIGNFIFSLALTEPVTRILRRFARRLQVETLLPSSNDGASFTFPPEV